MTVLPVLAAVMTRRSETAATEVFNGICVRIVTAPSTTRRHNLRSLEDSSPSVAVCNLRVSPV